MRRPGALSTRVFCGFSCCFCRCLQCNAGFYCTNASTTPNQHPCAAGRYGALPGPNTNSVRRHPDLCCLPHFAASVVQSCSGPCSPGFYCVAGSKVAAPAAGRCPVGCADVSCLAAAHAGSCCVSQRVLPARVIGPGVVSCGHVRLRKGPDEPTLQRTHRGRLLRQAGGNQQPRQWHLVSARRWVGA